MSLSSQHHSFDIALAAKYGIEEAILIHHFQHWIRINTLAQRNVREIEVNGQKISRVFTFQSRKEIAAHFPYWNYDRVKYLCEKLRDLGVLYTYNFNSCPIDKTVWYAFVNPEEFWVDPTSVNNYYSYSNKSYEGQKCPSKGKSALPIPDTKTKDTLTEKKKESAAPPPPLPSLSKDAQEARLPSPSSKEPPDKATEAAKDLLKRLKAIYPTLKDPKLKEWAKELDLINRIDKRSWEDIESMISWAFESAFWVKVIQSPSSLRKNWDKMAIQKIPVNNKGTTISHNRDYAQKVKSYLEKEGDGKIILIGFDYVQNRKNGDSIKFDLHSDQFKQIINKWFGIREKA